MMCGEDFSCNRDPGIHSRLHGEVASGFLDLFCSQLVNSKGLWLEAGVVAGVAVWTPKTLGCVAVARANSVADFHPHTQLFTMASSTDSGSDRFLQQASPQRVVFPNALKRADRHKPSVWFRRHALLCLLYSLWKGGIPFFMIMMLHATVCTTRYIATMGDAQLPIHVQIFLSLVAIYATYHTLRFCESRQGEWLGLRNLARHWLVAYPYFRHHACIFEEREQESLAEPEKPMVPPADKNMFVYHPHGVVSCGFAMNGVHARRFEKSNAHWLVSDKLFWIPLLGDILSWLHFNYTRKSTMVGLMERHENLCIMPGGFEEATLTARGKHRVYIKKRFGFIKLALQHGYKVSPVYSFGEEETFHALDYPQKLRSFFNKWKLPVVLFYGRPMCYFMPREDVELITVVGKPLQLPTIENPTKEEVAKYHQMYVDALVALFERNKHKYAVDPTVPLEVY